ncbi:hypothetical protein EDD53_2604 [Pacificibacter maritimus]|uniref:NAD(FAD)-utilizing dehydrogenase n=1 Tax=Pacificibacter maritimus TaxID=762213 RepID=A0A3N4UT28_9RHOB|nr:TIGR03862 family flavoprotein [Pacificibacter maritimus]RPE64840.1 hypothetical protein EDD53_2604 [Pacificibacter maritimus]
MNDITQTERTDALIIGAGPAGLMAADLLSQAGYSVILADAMPSPARKFLMAGKSGLNLTKNEDFAAFRTNFTPLPKALRQALDEFGPTEVMTWAQTLGQTVFTGSTGRVFPVAMKASPLLRAWLSRLDQAGVDLRRKWRWSHFNDGAVFETPDGLRRVDAKVTVLALGGASWARLGSNGAWMTSLDQVKIAPFKPANAALTVDWTQHMKRHFGKPIKGVSLSCGPYTSQGEFVISKGGLEGGGIYAVSRGLREGHNLYVDLLPNMPLEHINKSLNQRKAKDSFTNVLRKTLRLGPEKIALLMEFVHPLPKDIAPILKRLPIKDVQISPMDEAISTAGGIRFDEMTDWLELKQYPSVFACGEMLDWEAPTGGYLLTACFATGRRAALGALNVLRASKDV